MTRDMIDVLSHDLCEVMFGPATENELAMCREGAIAMLQRLKSPSDGMKVAGGLKCEALMFEDDPEFTGIIFQDMGVVFSTMIAQALNEAALGGEA